MSPFRSKAQRGYLFANKPAVAKEFAAATPPGKSLPARLISAKIAAQALKKKKL